MNAGFMDRVRSAGKGLLGTWVKIPAFETVELLAHAGFDFVVIDMEHSPLALDRVYELIFATQRMGMAALVRLPDQLGTPVQPLLDAGADGLLVPRVASLDAAAAIAARMVFSPAGERGLGFTSRAGRWALMPLPEYLKRGDEQCLRMIQLEDWATLQSAAQYAALQHVNGLFVGLRSVPLQWQAGECTGGAGAGAFGAEGDEGDRHPVRHRGGHGHRSPRLSRHGLFDGDGQQRCHAVRSRSSGVGVGQPLVRALQAAGQMCQCVCIRLDTGD